MSRDGDPHRDLEGTLHEISNALTVLLGWVAEARAPGATEEEQAHALKIVDQRARRARDLARRAIGAKTIPADIEADLGLVLADVVASLAIEASVRGVRIVLEGPADVARVALGDDLAQIVTNLVMNAIAYAPRDSDVRVVAIVQPTEISVEVIDRGPGVPVARQESVFEGDTTREGGAGVGLRHARAIARAAGGDLALVREEGGRFMLRWPRADVRMKPTASRRPSSEREIALSLAGTKVLVVEDDADVLDSTITMLAALGFEVLTAGDGPAALNRLRRERRIDLLFTDVVMPRGMNGVELAREARALRPEIKVLLASGYPMSALSSEQGLTDEFAFISKPYRRADLSDRLRALRDAG